MVFRYMECFHHSECIINIWVPNKNVVYSRQRPKKEKCTAYGRFRILFCLLFIYSTEESLCKWLTCTRPTCTQQTQINMLMTFIHHPAPYCFFADSPYGYLRWGFIGMKSNANQMYSTQQTHCVSIDCGMQIFRSNSTRGRTILYTKESKSVSISCSLRNTEYRWPHIIAN